MYCCQTSSATREEKSVCNSVVEDYSEHELLISPIPYVFCIDTQGEMSSASLYKIKKGMDINTDCMISACKFHSLDTTSNKHAIMI
jgi:hypothetical protein